MYQYKEYRLFSARLLLMKIETDSLVQLLLEYPTQGLIIHSKAIAKLAFIVNDFGCISS